METEHQKYVNLSYLAAAVLFGYVVFSAAGWTVGFFDLEARVRNIELILRGISVLAAVILFLGLYRNELANQFMNEVMAELARVSWPTPKDTRSATMIVIVMVLVSGVVLGLLDYIWIQLVKWIL